MLCACAAVAASARDARAYSPEAADWLAARVLAALPRPAQAMTRLPEVQLALEHLRGADELDPEAAELRRGLEWESPPGEASAGFPRGGALAAFAEARRALAEGWANADRVAAAAAMARLAQAAADLSDPFVVSPPDASELDGVRAWFSDSIAATELDAVDAPAGVWDPDAPLQLAQASAADLAAVCAAANAGDEVGVLALRAARLAAGLSLMKAAARDAVTPSTLGADGMLRCEPSPLRGPATLWLSMPGSADARLELFDVTGRRVRSSALGIVAAGEHRQVLAGSWFSGLPAGIYLARVTAGTSQAEVRIAFLGQ